MQTSNFASFYFLLLIYGKERFVFKSIFRNRVFDGFTHLEVHEFENHIYNTWFLSLFLSLSVCVCVCYQHNSKINYRRNSKLRFCMCIICTYYLTLFFEDQTNNLCIQRLSKELENITAYERNFL